VSEFHDPDLRQELGRLSGPYPDDNAAFAAWQRRVGHARRRRIVAWATGAALSLVVATVGAAALQSPGRHTLVPGESAEVSDDLDSTVATTEAEDSESTSVTAPETSMPTTLAPETTTGIVETSMPEVETEATAAAGDQPDNTVKSQPVNPATGASATKTISSTGGSITVQRDGDKLTVIAATPAAGFHMGEIPNSDDSLEVTFKSSDHRSEITAKLVDGVIRASVSEDTTTDGHDSTLPDGGGDGGHWGDGTDSGG
jgi:cytoskeletal protein RodZ